MKKQYNMLGSSGLICGILSILPVLIFIIGISIGTLGPVYYGILIGIVGMVLSGLQSKNADNQVSEVGLIVSIIGISLNMIIFVMFMGLFH
ncbi:MAG: hypothetical protein U9P81_07365 [Euryarchaeota archaeon]|nr:hypothetical protein [Euryarchaeota archaeon]